LDSFADARKVSLGLEGRLCRQEEITATATLSGIDSLKAVKVLSDDPKNKSLGIELLDDSDSE
jgi:hypothetical protein